MAFCATTLVKEGNDEHLEYVSQKKKNLSTKIYMDNEPSRFYNFIIVEFFP